MALFSWFSRTIGRTPRSIDVAQLAREAAAAVWSQLEGRTAPAASAERYGYLRAYATADVARLTAAALAALPYPLRPRREAIEPRVLDATIQLLIAQLAAGAARPGVRRAA